MAIWGQRRSVTHNLSAACSPRTPQQDVLEAWRQAAAALPTAGRVNATNTKGEKEVWRYLPKCTAIPSRDEGLAMVYRTTFENREHHLRTRLIERRRALVLLAYGGAPAILAQTLDGEECRHGRSKQFVDENTGVLRVLFNRVMMAGAALKKYIPPSQSFAPDLLDLGPSAVATPSTALPENEVDRFELWPAVHAQMARARMTNEAGS
ncbi:hypothetical protein MRX96_054631 [Rhipicephalus microplus]